MNEQIKIQPKSFLAYINIMKELKSKNTELTDKPKQERSFKVILKHIHSTANLDDIKKEIEDLEGYIVTRIWNNKEQGIKKALHILYTYSTYIFYVELKLQSNNRDIYEIASFSIAELNLNQNIQNVRFFNALIAGSTVIQKVFAFVKRDTSNMHSRPFNHQLPTQREIQER